MLGRTFALSPPFWLARTFHERNVYFAILCSKNPNLCKFFLLSASVRKIAGTEMAHGLKSINFRLRIGYGRDQELH